MHGSQTVEGPSALPSRPFSPLPSFCSGQALCALPLTQLPSDTKLRSRRCTRSPVHFPGRPGVHSSFVPFVFCHPPVFISLVAFSRCILSSFHRLVSSSGPHSVSPHLVSHLAEPRILFARVIVLRAYIPGEMHELSGIPFATCSLSAMDWNIPESTESKIMVDLII